MPRLNHAKKVTGSVWTWRPSDVCEVFVLELFTLWDLSALTLAPGGCLSDGQGAEPNRGLLQHDNIPLIARCVLWPWTTPTLQHVPLSPALTEREQQIIFNYRSRTASPAELISTVQEVTAKLVVISSNYPCSSMSEMLGVWKLMVVPCSSPIVHMIKKNAIYPDINQVLDFNRETSCLL